MQISYGKNTFLFRISGPVLPIKERSVCAPVEFMSKKEFMTSFWRVLWKELGTAFCNFIL